MPAAFRIGWSASLPKSRPWYATGTLAETIWLAHFADASGAPLVEHFSNVRGWPLIPPSFSLTYWRAASAAAPIVGWASGPSSMSTKPILTGVPDAAATVLAVAAPVVL